MFVQEPVTMAAWPGSRRMAPGEIGTGGRELRLGKRPRRQPLAGAKSSEVLELLRGFGVAL